LTARRKIQANQEYGKANLTFSHLAKIGFLENIMIWFVLPFCANFRPEN